MTLPLDLAKISWTGGGVSRFAVQGQVSAMQLLAQDPGTTSVFTHTVSLGIEANQNQVAVGLHHQVHIHTGQPLALTDIMGDFELGFYFTIDNLSDLLLPPTEAEPGNGGTIHPQLALLLVSVAYSTARGILSVRLQGTPLEGVNLPLVDPKQLLIPGSSATVVK